MSEESATDTCDDVRSTIFTDWTIQSNLDVEAVYVDGET